MGQEELLSRWTDTKLSDLLALKMRGKVYANISVTLHTMTTHNPGRFKNIRENLYFQTCWHRELSAYHLVLSLQTHQKATRT